MLVIASIQAVLGEIGFVVVGLPSPLLWGVVLFFLSMIPMAGSFLVCLRTSGCRSANATPFCWWMNGPWAPTRPKNLC